MLDQVTKWLIYGRTEATDGALAKKNQFAEVKSLNISQGVFGY